MNGAERIAAERRRQVEVEGYDAEHDRGHADELAKAGACYAAHEHMPFRIMTGDGWAKTVPTGWPWDGTYWRPTPDDRIRELVKAGALIAAAIDDLLTQPAPAEEVR